MHILLNIFLTIAIFILLRYDSLKKTIYKLLVITSFFAIVMLFPLLSYFCSQQYEVQIIASNEKNSASDGKEIWLEQVVINDIIYQPTQIFSPGWISEETAYVWRNYKQSEGMSDSIHATFSRKDSVKLIFQRNKWRGIVQIRMGQKTESVDLYMDTESKAELYVYTLPSSTKVISSQMVYLCVFIVVLLLALLYGVYTNLRDRHHSSPPNALLNKERILWLDLLKVCSAFMIVMIHASGTYFNQTALFTGTWWKMLWINAIPRFAVPCFLMITGILYLERKDSFRYSVNQAKRIAIILLIWSCIYIFARKMLWNAPQSSMIREILKIPFTHVASPLWYGYELIWIFLTLPFWQFLYQNTTQKQQLYFISITLFLPAGLDFVGRMLLLDDGGYAPFGTHVFFVNYIGLLFLGAFLNDRIAQQRKSRLFVLGGLLVSMGITLMILGTKYLTIYTGKTVHDLFGETRLPSIIYSMGVIIIFYALSGCVHFFPVQIKHAISSLAQVSLGMYFSHLLAIWCFPDILIGSFYFSNTMAPKDVLLLVCFYFTITAFSTLLLSKIPYLKRLVS